jgi:anti-repressor protein
MENKMSVVPFNFEGNQIRTITDEKGEPWFVAKDVCDVLGYVNQSRDVQRHCKYAKILKGTESVLLTDSPRGVSIIPESDLYRLIMRSNMPDAERFQDWVTEIVLPQIRKTGGYIAGEERMNDDQLLAAALMVAQRKIEERNRIIEEQRPKVEAYDHFMDVGKAFPMDQVAKALYDSDRIKIGRNNLFVKLRSWGFVANNNVPYQRYVNAGWFETRIGSNQHGFSYIQTLVTPKGIDAIRRKFLDELEAYNA